MTIRRFNEALGYGRFSNRTCYAADPDNLPEPLAGAEWKEDTSFREDEAIANDPRLGRVFD